MDSDDDDNTNKDIFCRVGLLSQVEDDDSPGRFTLSRVPKLITLRLWSWDL